MALASGALIPGPNGAIRGSLILKPVLVISLAGRENGRSSAHRQRARHPNPFLDKLMRILALETIERRGSLAALTTQAADCQLVCERLLPEKERSACTLIPQLESLLSECGWKATDVELVCVATGPGSFTGLRIGVTIAKTLAYTTGAKLVGVHSLSAMAAGVGKQSQRVWTVLDAQRQELFAASFPADCEAVSAHPPETRLLPIDEWLALLAPGDLVCGPPLKGLADRIPSGVAVADSQLWSPTASSVGKLGFELFQASSDTDPMQMVPRYYRKSAAEEKADSNAKL